VGSEGFCGQGEQRNGAALEGQVRFLIGMTRDMGGPSDDPAGAVPIGDLSSPTLSIGFHCD
jgi:hypothetical protein